MTVAATARQLQVYELDFEHRPDHLYVHVKNDLITYELAKRYWTEIVAMVHHRRYDRILVDKEISMPLPIHDVFTLVSELAHSGCNRVKFAIYDHFYEAERASFEEMIGTNRGLRVKIFGDRDAAEAWLLEPNR